MTTPVAPVDYMIIIQDHAFNFIGDPIVCWSNIDVTLRFNEPSTGIFTVPAYPWIINQISAGNRILMFREDKILIGGPIEKWLHERSNDGENAGVGELTVNFSDDLSTIAARMTYPNPTQTIEGQTADHWAFTNNAEFLIRQLVLFNAGASALAPRRIPGLVILGSSGLGTTVTVNAERMQPLLDVARSMAELGGNLGFRTFMFDPSTPVFEVYQPVDKSDTVKFGFGLGNMAYVAYEVNAPTATTVAVGGQGDTGAAAYMMERNNSADEATWGRFEKLIARAGDSETQSLQDDGDQALGEGAPTTRLASNLLDIPDQRFSTHYNVGDIVTVETFPGHDVTDIVRTVHLQVYPTSGEYASATVGNQAAVTDPIWVQRLRQIDERLGQLERTSQTNSS